MTSANGVSMTDLSVRKLLMQIFLPVLAALAFFGGPFGRVIARPAHGALRAAGRPAPGGTGPGAAGLWGQVWQVSHRVSASGKP